MAPESALSARISKTQFDALVTTMKLLNSVLNYDYAVDGCYSRDLITKYHLYSMGIPADSLILASQSEKGLNSSKGVTWGYHIAPMVEVDQKKFILDAAFGENHVLTVDEWKNEVDQNITKDDKLRWGIAKGGRYGGDLYIRDEGPPVLVKASISPYVDDIKVDWQQLESNTTVESMKFDIKDLEDAFATQFTSLHLQFNEGFGTVHPILDKIAEARLKRLARHGLDLLESLKNKGESPISKTALHRFEQKLRIVEANAAAIYQETKKYTDTHKGEVMPSEILDEILGAVIESCGPQTIQ